MIQLEKKNLAFIAGFLVIALGALGYGIYTSAPQNAGTPAEKTASGTSTDSGNSEDGGEIVDPAGFEAIPLVDNQDIPHPPIEKTVTYSPIFDAASKEQMEQKFAEIRANLEATPSSFSDWLDLALLYKTAGDYRNAEEVWLYLNEAAPNQSISFGNLGNLYALELREYAKAEANYKQAIENNPGQAAYYQNLHELYKYSYKQDTNLAVQTLLDGVEAVGDNSDGNLLMSLARYYEEGGDTANAIKYFKEALTRAETRNDQGAISYLNQKIFELEEDL